MPQKQEVTPMSPWKLWLLYGFLALVMAVSVTVLWGFYSFKIFKVPQNGMYPAIGAGEHILVRKRAYRQASDVKRGDVVVYEQEKDGQSYYYVWRVIGLPGETVTIREGIVGINGREAAQEKMGNREDLTIAKEKLDNLSYEIAFDPKVSAPPLQRTIQVPADHFFVMGDNRNHAYDSRFEGPIAFSSIVGKSLH